MVAQAVRGLADSTTQALDSIRARIDAIGGAVKEAAEASGQMSSLSSATKAVSSRVWALLSLRARIS